jgi:hypothetical protein
MTANSLDPKWLWTCLIDDGTAVATADFEDFDPKEILVQRKTSQMSRAQFILAIESRVKYLGQVTFRADSSASFDNFDYFLSNFDNVSSESVAASILTSFVSSLSLRQSLTFCGRVSQRQLDGASSISSKKILVQPRFIPGNQSNCRDFTTQRHPELTLRVISAESID